ITRSKKISKYTDNLDEIFHQICLLFDEHWSETPIRLLGVTVQELMEADQIKEQLSLFSYQEEERKAKIEATKKQLTDKFGATVFKQLHIVDEEEKDDYLRTSFQKDFLDDFKK